MKKSRDDITENRLQLYVAFKKIRNIVTARVMTDKVMLWLNLNGKIAEEYKGIARDVTNIGHWGTGSLELTIKNNTDFERVKELIARAYNEG